MRPKSRTEFRFAVICALTLEAEAVEATFDETYDRFGKVYGKRRGDANAYINGRIGKHDIVLCYMPGMGKGSAASVASSLRVSYTKIQLTLVVGICGGAPMPLSGEEIFLGDVIISNALVEYDFGRQYPSGFKRKSEALRRPDQEVRTLLAALSTSRARAEFRGEMISHLHLIQQQSTRWQHPGSADILFDASYYHKHHHSSTQCCCSDSDLLDEICEEAYEQDCNSLGCDENRILRRRDNADKPSIHIGKVATADVVMKSGEHRDKIISKEKVFGFEMEGAGVWDNVSCIIIKGVCDYADSHKNKTWQAYTAATGAATAKAFLEYWRPVDREEYLVESESQLETTKLSKLEEVCKISTNLQSFQSKVSALNTPIQGIQNTLSDFEARFVTLENLVTQLVHQTATDGSPQKVNPKVVTGRLLRKPGVLKDICDVTKARETPVSNATLPAMTQNPGKTSSRNIGWSFLCMCRSRRQLQRKTIIIRGSLTFSFQTTTEQHLPGCPAKQKSKDTDQSRSFSLTYSGLQSLLNLAIQLSFTATSGAGGGSLSPSFTYFPTVDSNSAPVWKMLKLLIFSRYHGLNVISWEKLVSAVVPSAMTLLRAGMASPRAVDAENKSLIHLLTRCVNTRIDERENVLMVQAKPDPLLEFLDYLLVNKAPANNYDMSGNTPLSSMFEIHGYSSFTKPRVSAIAEVILQSNTEANVACLSDPPGAKSSTAIDHLGRRVFKQGPLVLLDFLSFSPRIAEAYDCGPLSLAILSKNLGQVGYLVRKHPCTLDERDLFGHTPLHLAADKPSCLRVLVSTADTKLLNETDRDGISALETAVHLSGLRCREGESGSVCRRCTCAECAVILLNAGCALPVTEGLQRILSAASIRCKRRYVRHMKDRRDKLKQLALDNLPATEVEQLGLASDVVLDSLASRIVHLLKDRDVSVPDALAATKTRSLSVYQVLSMPEDAELFFRLGFHDTDSWYDPSADAMESDYLPEKDLQYLHWLAKHGATSCQLMSFESAMDVFMANYTYWQIGELYLRNLSWRIGDEAPWSPKIDGKYSQSLTDVVAWVYELNALILPAQIADHCNCKCSSEGCTPFTSLLKAISYANGGLLHEIRHTGSFHPVTRCFTVFLKYFGNQLEARHYTVALRYLTYTALGIPHTCCRSFYKSVSNPDQDVEDVEDEHAYELELLEELVSDFNGQILAIYDNPFRGISDVIYFWTCTWRSQMREVLDRLEGNSLGDEERRNAEKIGVIWDDLRPEASIAARNPYKWNTLDHWMYELEKIQAECQ